MLDQQVISQVKGVLGNLSTSFTFVVERSLACAKVKEFSSFVEDVASCSPRLSVEYRNGKDFRFSILRNGEPTGVSFRGIPSGHEFTSLLLVLLNGDGQGRNLPDAALLQRIKALKGDIRLTTYVSLTCTNCPDVVQALNIMALSNPSISHETVDGAICQDEVEKRNIQAVPAVYLGDELLHVGRGTLGGLLEELEDHLGADTTSGEKVEHSFDLLVLGGGPAGVAAAIYAARKGKNVAVVAQRIGGQVNDTTGIENIISVPLTTRFPAGIRPCHTSEQVSHQRLQQPPHHPCGFLRTREARGDTRWRDLSCSPGDYSYGRRLATPGTARRG